VFGPAGLTSITNNGTMRDVCAMLAA
jgi:hypothetical protein